MIKSLIERTVKSIGHLAKEELKSTVEEYKVKELLKKSQSSNITESVLAKIKLKNSYPEIWAILKKEIK